MKRILLVVVSGLFPLTLSPSAAISNELDWQPPAGSTPASGSYLYLESDPGDYIGRGQNYLYTLGNALIPVSQVNGIVYLRIEGDERWYGFFKPPVIFPRAEAGYYPTLQGYRHHLLGSFDFWGEGRSCNAFRGWFSIDSITYEPAGDLEDITLRFEQRCEGATSAALRGKLTWDRNDTPPPQPDPGPAPIWQPPAGSTPANETYLYLESDPGDWVGGGGHYLYTLDNAVIPVNEEDGLVSLRIDGEERWHGYFRLPVRHSRAEAGYYPDLRRYPYHNPTKGGIDFDAWSCNKVKGWFVIDSITYNAAEELEDIALRFEQRCDGATGSLRGKLRWNSNDSSPLPNPGPTPSWQPPADSTPASGTYLYLESDPGDYIGGGRKYLYTLIDALMFVSQEGRHIYLGINGDERWQANFEVDNYYSRAEAGYYPDLRRYPFHNPAKGGLDFGGEGRGCNNLKGWFVIDSITYDPAGELEDITIRFEQHCEERVASLRGKLHWNRHDTPPPPPDPGPTPTWQPIEGSTPESGTYVYLESDPRDWVGQGGNYLYTLGDALISVSEGDGGIFLGIYGDESWHGTFKVPDSYSRAEAGYYPDLQRYPFHNPAKGGLDFGGEGRGCNELKGWFVIDSITYDPSGDLEIVTLRFEQQCEGDDASLRGKLQWNRNDTPPPPPDPGPAPTWQPGVSLPETGTYLVLESDPGDYIGGGKDYLYTGAGPVFSVGHVAGHVSLEVRTTERWGGGFKVPIRYSRAEAGYYPDLQRYPFHNPVKGGLNFSGQGRGCNTLTGWFVIDSISYDFAGELEDITLRFEQHCEGAEAALRGKLRWKRILPIGGIV